MRIVAGFLMVAATLLAAAPARAQDDKEELKKKLLEEIAKKLEEESKRILEEISKLIDDEIAKFRGRKPADAPAPVPGKPGFLGVQVDQEQQPGEDDFKAWKIEGGVRIVPIEGGPAATAGLKDGDVIFEADGKKIREWAELPEAIRARKAGEKVKLKVIRGKETKEITVTLGARLEEPGGAPPPPAPVEPPAKIGRIGISPGDPTGKGMAIDSVNPDLPAAKAGIKAGDVLTKIDDTPIWKESDLEAFMKKTKPGQTVEITVLRDGKEQKFSVVLAGS